MLFVMRILLSLVVIGIVGQPNALREGLAATSSSDTLSSDQEKGDGVSGGFWAFQAPVKPDLPSIGIKSWLQSPVDCFILCELEARQLQPSSPADKRTLIRRLTFDLLGLPPTVEEVNAFVADSSPHAYQKLVDRLLSSVHYGQRWGRHWLDIARYADSNGLDENIAHGHAWRYRDYVVAALNQDKPFDQFIVEQIAGDLLPYDDNDKVRHENLIATGFLSLGPKVLAEGDQQKLEMDIIDEQIDTLGRALMGMTIGCARCHDHKFDPISTEDYYALAGIFKSTKTMESLNRIARWNENVIASAEQLAAKKAHDELVAAAKKTIEERVNEANEVLSADLAEGESLPEDAESKYPDETKQELQQLREHLKNLEKSLPKLATAMGVVEGEVQNLKVHIRGDPLQLGTEVSRGVPAVAAFDGQLDVPSTSSGRLELARWFVRPGHPLTARVMVNRVWRWHFGRGIVSSTDNFGELGDRPVNGHLLDWLAVRFIESEWSVKALHRMVVLSNTYRQTSDRNTIAENDVENQFLWRANTRRLEAEVIRDALLAVSGLMDHSLGGSLLHVENRAFLFDHTSKDETTYDSRKRSIYLPVIRNHLYDVFSLFDYSDASVTNGNRSTSTVATQALFALNSDLMLQASEALAGGLLFNQAGSDEERINRLYEIAYSRRASESESQRAVEFIARFQNELGDRKQAWTSLCQVVLASNEFIYIR